VKLRNLGLLCDENIDPQVVAKLRMDGADVLTVAEAGLAGAIDPEVLARAHSEGRVVLTHDVDFGMLAIARGQPHTGIVYLRTGGLRVSELVEVVDATMALDEDLALPFIAVVTLRSGGIRIRIRPRPPSSDR
jgi:predicted nuclease of predicted toxin-antitoxin system